MRYVALQDQFERVSPVCDPKYLQGGSQLPFKRAAKSVQAAGATASGRVWSQVSSSGHVSNFDERGDKQAIARGKAGKKFLSEAERPQHLRLVYYCLSGSVAQELIDVDVILTTPCGP